MESEYAGDNGVIFSGEISIPSIILSPSTLYLNLRQGENSYNELEITNTLKYDLDLSIDKIIWEETPIIVQPNSDYDNSTQDQFSYSYNYYSFNISQEQMDNYLKSIININDYSIYRVGAYVFDAEGMFVDYVYNYDNQLTAYHQIPNSAVPGIWTMVLFAEGFNIKEAPIDLRLFSLESIEWNWTEVSEPSNFFKGKDKATINISVPNDYPTGENIAFLSLVGAWWKGTSTSREFYKPLSVTYPVFMDISEAECQSDSDCDNNIYCDGSEKCIAGVCIDASPIICDDNIECTNNICDETSDSCSFLPDNSNCEENFFCNPLIGCQINEVLILDYPKDGAVYNERSFVLSANIDKDVDWFYEIKSKRSKLKKICNEVDICEKKLRFNEGLNELLINTKDTLGDYEEKIISFRVDSKSPSISKTEPRRNSFTNGSGFYIKVKEDNLKNITITFNPKIGLDLNKCTESRGYYECYIDLNLTSYNDQEIDYYFGVEDIAGNKDESKPTSIKVDTASPVLSNPDSFWARGEGRYSNYIYFDMSINEKNFDEVVLSYDYRGRTKEKRLCSRLKYGKCEYKFRLNDAYSNYELIIRDDAGNVDSREINL